MNTIIKYIVKLVMIQLKKLFYDYKIKELTEKIEIEKKGAYESEKDANDAYGEFISNYNKYKSGKEDE